MFIYFVHLSQIKLSITEWALNQPFFADFPLYYLYLQTERALRIPLAG